MVHSGKSQGRNKQFSEHHSRQEDLKINRVHCTMDNNRNASIKPSTLPSFHPPSIQIFVPLFLPNRRLCVTSHSLPHSVWSVENLASLLKACCLFICYKSCMFFECISRLTNTKWQILTSSIRIELLHTLYMKVITRIF